MTQFNLSVTTNVSKRSSKLKHAGRIVCRGIRFFPLSFLDLS